MSTTRSRFQGALLTVWTVFAASAVALPEQQPRAGIEVFPKHFQLRPGEAIRFQSLEHDADGRMRFLEDYSFATTNPKVFELKDQRGLFLARSPGRAEMILTSRNREQRYQIRVGEGALPQLNAIPYSEVDSIVGGKELLFVGHANRDGFDHTAIAKAGIDRVVREFKRNGHRDHWGTGSPRQYPAPAVLLGAVWDRKGSDAARYNEFVVPFLDTLFTKYPVLGYPTDARAPALSALVHDWNVQVRVGEIERTYRKVNTSRTIRLEFVRRCQGPLSSS